MTARKRKETVELITVHANALLDLCFQLHSKACAAKYDEVAEILRDVQHKTNLTAGYVGLLIEPKRKHDH